jgi:hypothetical protein
MIQIRTLQEKAPPDAQLSLKRPELFEILATLTLKALAAATGDMKSTKPAPAFLIKRSVMSRHDIEASL